MKGIELRQKRKEFGFTQIELAEKLGLERKTIINYEKLDSIPESKSTFLYNFFKSLSDNEKKGEDIFIVKDGVKFYLKEAAELIARNPEASKEEPLIKQYLANNFLKIIQDSTDGNGVSLTNLLKNIKF